MEGLIKKFQDLKTLLSQRIAPFLREAMLKAFLGALEDYQAEVERALGYSRKKMDELKGENDLLRSLVGFPEAGFQGKIIEQGAEIQFLREQLLARRRALEENKRAMDGLRLEIERKESELKARDRIRSDENEKFNNVLEQLKRQLQEIEKKSKEKEEGIDQREKKMAQEYAARVQRVLQNADNEMRAVSARLYNACALARDCSERCLDRFTAIKPLLDSLPPVAPSATAGAFPPSGLLDELSKVKEYTQDMNQAMGRYTQLLNLEKPQIAKLGWPKLWNELRKRAKAFPLPPEIKITWPQEKADVPLFTDERIVLEIGEILVRNAVEAMPSGGTLEISVSSAPGQIIIRFADTGHGIKPQDLGNVFMPFFTTKQGHDGLGLCRALRQARLLGGNIACEPRKAGTLFVVTLPEQKEKVMSKQ